MSRKSRSWLVIDKAHRLRSTQKNKNALPFMIELVSRFKKTESIKQVKQIKPTAQSYDGNTQNKIFYTDHLTRRNQEILYEARKQGKKYFVWTKNGALMYREQNKEGTKANRIKSIREVEYFWQKVPNTEEENVGLRFRAEKRSVDQTSPEVRNNFGKKASASNGGHGLDRFRYSR